MASGVDLNLRSAGGGGSSAVQMNTSDPVARALQGAGGTIANIGVSKLAANKKREEDLASNLAKANEELETERQKIFDSSSDADNRNRITAANDGIKATIVENPGNTNLWNETFEETYNEVDRLGKESAAGLSPEAQRKESEYRTAQRISNRGNLNIQIVRAEVEASKEKWKLNAKLASDRGDREAFDFAVDEVKWTNDAERDEFKIDTWQAGRYSEINNEMLVLDSPDKLYAKAKEVEGMGVEDLSKAQRNTLAVLAKQKAVKRQAVYNTTQRAYNKDLKNNVEIDPQRMIDDLAQNRISVDMVKLFERQNEEVAASDDYRVRYNGDLASVTYKRKYDDIFFKYLKADTAEENPELSSKELNKIIEDIDSLDLGEWAKGDLYAMAFAAKTEALMEPDHGWGFGYGVGLGVSINEDIKDTEREFRREYTRSLSLIMNNGQVVMEGLGDQFIKNDTAITQAFKAGADPDPKKMMEEFLKPMIKGMMNTEFKRKLTRGPVESILDNNGEVNKFKDASDDELTNF